MSLIAQQLYAQQMKDKGYTIAYYLMDSSGNMVHKPIPVDKDAIGKLRKFDKKNKYYLSTCWIDEKENIVG